MYYRNTAPYTGAAAFARGNRLSITRHKITCGDPRVQYRRYGKSPTCWYGYCENL